MNWQEIAGGVINALRNAGVKKDIIDLQEKQVALLTKEIDTLTAKLRFAETENANLTAKVIDLEQQLDRLRPSGERLNRVQDEFLKVLFDANECALDYVSSSLRIQYGIVAHHKDVLLKLEMIRWTGSATGDFGEGLPTYELTPKGRAYVVKYLID